MFNNTLSAILRGVWLIDRQFAESHLPLVLGVLQGKLSGAEFFSGRGEREDAFVINSKGKKVSAFVWNWQENKYEPNEKQIDAGSVAVIPVIGPITKYNGECGEPGTVKRTAWTNDLISLPSIEGMISYIDSPGGQADGTPQFTDYIKNVSKKTIAVVEGGAYSAGAWIASGHDAIYAANKYAGFGSIGAYTTLVDYRGYFEKEGYKLITIYPEVSKDKNLSYRQALEGNTKLITEEITALAMSFIESFAENRAGKLTSDEWNTGKVFKADQAIRMGLMDGIKSIDQAAAEIRGKKIFPASTGSTAQTTAQLQNETHMKFPNIAVLAGVAAPTKEQLDLANADLTTSDITGATLVAEGFITEAANVTTERNTLQEANTALTSNLATANEALTTANASLTAEQEKVTKLTAEKAELETRLRAMGGGQHNSSEGSAGDTPPPSNETDYEAVMNNLPHNRKADELLGK